MISSERAIKPVKSTHFFAQLADDLCSVMGDSHDAVLPEKPWD